MILHLVTSADWESAPAGLPFIPRAYAADGFIHCTQGDALMLTVANRFYKTQPGDFLAVAIDETRVAAPVKWEAPADPSRSAASPSGQAPADSSATPATAPAQPAGALPPEVEAEFGLVGAGTGGSVGVAVPAPTLFPHIYGPLNRDAIIGLRRLLRNPDGTFAGFAPLEDAPRNADPANPLNLKPASVLANELLDATDEFSRSLDRYKDSIEARMAELDKKIKRL